MRKLVIPVIILLYGCLADMHDGNVQVGRVLSKTVVGRIDGRIIPLIHMENGSTDIIDTALNRLIRQPDGNLVVNDTVEQLLKNKYHEINYSATIRLCVREENVEYELNRSDFNTLAIDLIVKFQEDRTVSNRIERLLKH